MTTEEYKEKYNITIEGFDIDYVTTQEESDPCFAHQFATMINIKKLFSSFLTTVFVVVGLVGCQADTDTGQGDKEQTVQETQQATETTTGQTEQTVENVEMSKTETSAPKKDNLAETVVIAGHGYDINETDIFLLGMPVTDDDLKALLSFKELKNLSIDLLADGCEITDLSILSQLKSLETLYISGTYEDFGFLENMTSLKDITISHFFCDTIKNVPLDNTITVLKCYESEIQSLSWLSNMSMLRELEFSHFACNDYSGIGNINNLEILHMNLLEKYDVDLSFLNSLKSLRDFEYCMVHGSVNFNCVSECINLEKIYVFDYINDFNFCNSLSNLKVAVFYASDDREYDLTPIANCVGLEKLELYCNYSDDSLSVIKDALINCEIAS